MPAFCFEGLNFPFFFSLPTAIVGPPKLSWLLQGHILNVNIIMPLTPYRSTNGSYKPVDQVLLKLWYWLNLYEGDVLVQQVRGGAGKAQSARDLQKLSWCSKDARVRLHCCGTACSHRVALALPTPSSASRHEMLCTPSSGLTAYGWQEIPFLF